ncbi:MAG TPA: sugar ABC transporter permease [Spirochaetia bacterium]|nr:sugar ABC transporter permease [Spirochaetia bacterium]
MIKRSKAYIGFIMPGFCIYTLFMIVPLFAAIYYSLFKWAGVGDMSFVGLENFRRIFFDPRMSKIFFNALGNNFKYMLIAVFIFIPIQTFMAYLIHIRIPGHMMFRLLIFFPYVISSSIVGFFSLLVFDPNIGILNKLLKAIGLSAWVSAWFGDPAKAFPLLVSIIGWQGIGVGMAIILANMKSIPNEVIEASIIDGAGVWSRFWNIEFPFLKPSLINVTVLSSIFALTQFDLPFIIGGAIGGIDGKTDFLNLVFYRYTFGGAYMGETNIGFGASISVVLFFIILFIAMVQNFGVKKIFKKSDSGD